MKLSIFHIALRLRGPTGGHDPRLGTPVLDFKVYEEHECHIAVENNNEVPQVRRQVNTFKFT